MEILLSTARSPAPTAFDRELAVDRANTMQPSEAVRARFTTAMSPVGFQHQSWSRPRRAYRESRGSALAALRLRALLEVIRLFFHRLHSLMGLKPQHPKRDERRQQ